MKLRPTRTACLRTEIALVMMLLRRTRNTLRYRSVARKA
jgi:hypothetical protein